MSNRFRGRTLAFDAAMFSSKELYDATFTLDHVWTRLILQIQPELLPVELGGFLRDEQPQDVPFPKVADLNIELFKPCPFPAPLQELESVKEEEPLKKKLKASPSKPVTRAARKRNVLSTSISQAGVLDTPTKLETPQRTRPDSFILGDKPANSSSSVKWETPSSAETPFKIATPSTPILKPIKMGQPSSASLLSQIQRHTSPQDPKSFEGTMDPQAFAFDSPARLTPEQYRISYNPSRPTIQPPMRARTLSYGYPPQAYATPPYQQASYNSAVNYQPAPHPSSYLLQALMRTQPQGADLLARSVSSSPVNSLDSFHITGQRWVCSLCANRFAYCLW
jgi:hypothetical protein